MQSVLTELPACAGVSIVQEDSQSLSTEIAKALASIGMMILLGTPGFRNDVPLGKLVNAKIEVELLVREVPTIWRRSKNPNPIHCSDLGQAVAQALQNVWFAGFQPLRIIHGYPLGSVSAKGASSEPIIFQDFLLQIETMQIFNLAT